MVLLKGSVKLRSGNQTMILSQEEGAFINSNVLHSKVPIESHIPISHNQIFDAGMIVGGTNSIFEQKYVIPMLQCHTLEMCRISSEGKEMQNILHLRQCSYEEAERADIGYELEIRSILMKVWNCMYKKYAPFGSELNISASRSEERLKKMLRFMHAHFGEKISLARQQKVPI